MSGFAVTGPSNALENGGNLITLLQFTHHSLAAQAMFCPLTLSNGWRWMPIIWSPIRLMQISIVLLNGLVDVSPLNVPNVSLHFSGWRCIDGNLAFSRGADHCECKGGWSVLCYLILVVLAQHRLLLYAVGPSRFALHGQSREKISSLFDSPVQQSENSMSQCLDHCWPGWDFSL